jgi:hypothetical protein
MLITDLRSLPNAEERPDCDDTPMVSHTAWGEYGHKLDLYQKMGVLYYAVYNPEFYQRDQHNPFEVYKLENGAYLISVYSKINIIFYLRSRRDSSIGIIWIT